MTEAASASLAIPHHASDAASDTSVDDFEDAHPIDSPQTATTTLPEGTPTATPHKLPAEAALSASAEQTDAGGPPPSPGAASSCSDQDDRPVARPFSLSSVPATPSTGTPRCDSELAAAYERALDGTPIAHGDSPFAQDRHVSPGDPNEPVATKVWRNSITARRLTGDLSNVGLDDDVLESVASLNGGPSSTGPAERTTVGSSGSLRSPVLPSDIGGADPEFMLQRIEAQNAILARDPKTTALDGSVAGEVTVPEAGSAASRSAGGAHPRRSFECTEEKDGDILIDWDFWGAVINNYEEVATTRPRELSRAIQSGIPPALRGILWQLMSSSKDAELELTYSRLLSQPSSHEKAISRDLGRTFPQHEYFQEGGGVGQDSLMAVCKAYSLYDEEVGYTQGLQFIVGPLLLNMPDEEAFCVLVRLMKSYDLRSLFKPSMPRLQLLLFQFDRLLEELLPHVFMHLLRQGIKSSMYASQWFLTLFGYRFPLELVSVVMDLVFAEGVEAVFRFSLALMQRNQESICGLDFDKLLDFLKLDLFEPYKNEPTGDVDPDALPTYKAHEFVKEALRVKITPVMLDQYAAEWDTMCRQQNAHTLELESLRQANTQLSSQVRRLEASLAQINEEHCDLVKQVVMAKLEREELEEQLVRYKLMYADLSHRQASEGSQQHRESVSSAQSLALVPSPLGSG